jgi:hypothetical protein
MLYSLFAYQRLDVSLDSAPILREATCSVASNESLATIVRTVAEGNPDRDWREENRSGQLSSCLNQPSVTRRR